MESPTRQNRRVLVLEEDPDLADALDPQQRPAAQRASLAAAFASARGPLTPPRGVEGTTAMGLLVLSGALGARVKVDGSFALELLGPGDVARPWLQAGGDSFVATSVDWFVRAPTEVAVLDDRFLGRMGPWPAIVAALAERLVLRARRLMLQLAIQAMTRVEARVLTMLWSLADRFGRVTREGVRLALPLTHDEIAGLVGARRPSVTTAITHLRRDGRLAYGPRGIVLVGEPPATVGTLREQSALPSLQLR